VSALKIGILIGSTRPGRRGEEPARWLLDIASKRNDAQYDLIDLADFDLPLLDEVNNPSQGQYEHEHTKRWAEKIGQYDGFVFVTAEYNHGVPAALKNALDYLYAEWNNKAVAFVSYGAAASGQRAAEQLRTIVGELQMADVRQQVAFSLFSDWEQFTTFAPAESHVHSAETMLDQLVAWTKALHGVRTVKSDELYEAA
jgi:NAD(P)H-dependent FMN reductase